MKKGAEGGKGGGLKRLCYSNGNVGHLVSEALLPSASNGKISAASMLTLGQFFSSTTDKEEDKKDIDQFTFFSYLINNTSTGTTIPTSATASTSSTVATTATAAAAAAATATTATATAAAFPLLEA